MSATPVVKVGREASKYLLRMPEQMLHELRIEANINGRSLNSEILARLQASIDGQSHLLQGATRTEDVARAAYRAMDNNERALLDILRKLPPAKQLALISLFK